MGEISVKKTYLIGEFSERSGVSKRMLRHYDKLDLFTPIDLNAENGYRYYSEEQVVDLRRIQFLKDLGFTLGAIKEILSKPLEIASFIELLKDREVVLNRESDEIKSNLLLLKRAIIYLDSQSPCVFPSIDQLMELEGSITMEKNVQKKAADYVDFRKLMNRDAFMEKIEEIFENDHGDQYHFLTFDIDNFMHVNDLDGYEVGDAVIQRVFSQIIGGMKSAFENLGDGVLMARLGGDECSVFLKNADHSSVIETIEEIFDAVRAYDFKQVGCSREITISCGIYKSGKPLHAALMKDQSLKALLEAKRKGRNQYV